MNDNHIIISDELLSAFLDGNTSAEDTMRVLKAAEQDENYRKSFALQVKWMKIWQP